MSNITEYKAETNLKNVYIEKINIPALKGYLF